MWTNFDPHDELVWQFLSKHSNSARSPPVLYVSTGSLWKGILLGGFFYWRSVLSDYTWHVVNGKKVFLVLRQKKGKRHQHTKWYNLWPWSDEIPKAFTKGSEDLWELGTLLETIWPFCFTLTDLLYTYNDVLTMVVLDHAFLQTWRHMKLESQSLCAQKTLCYTTTFI